MTSQFEGSHNLFNEQDPDISELDADAKFRIEAALLEVRRALTAQSGLYDPNRLKLARLEVARAFQAAEPIVNKSNI
jgi:hypothetical protein